MKVTLGVDPYNNISEFQSGHIFTYSLLTVDSIKMNNRSQENREQRQGSNNNTDVDLELNYSSTLISMQEVNVLIM